MAANQGIDVIDFTAAALKELHLTPYDLEVPLPAVLKTKTTTAVRDQIAAAIEAASSSSNKGAVVEIDSESKSTTALPIPPLNDMAQQPSSSIRVSSACDPAAAATTIQAAWRGWKDRSTVAELKLKELEFLEIPTGIESAQQTANSVNCQALEEAAAARRERRQGEYEAARREIEALLNVEEAPFLALEERTRVHTWLEERIDPTTGRWPEVPLQGDLETISEQKSSTSSQKNEINDTRRVKPAQKAAATAAVPSPASKQRQPSVLQAIAIPPSTALHATSTSFLAEMDGVLNKWKKEWQLIENKDVAAQNLDNSSSSSSAELDGLPLPRRGSSVDAVDLSLVTAEVRPRVKTNTQLSVREQARQAAAAANATLPPVASKTTSKTTGKKEASAVATGSTKQRPSMQRKQSTATTTTSIGKVSKEKPQQQQAVVDIELVFKELAMNGLMRFPRSDASLSHFLGECTFAADECVPGMTTGATASGQSIAHQMKKTETGGKGSTTTKSNTTAAKASALLLPYPELSLAQVRQIVTLQCALPLAARGAHSKLREVRPTAALIYGPVGSGKKMLVEAVAQEAGAVLFTLSPSALVGKYPGKEADAAVHAVFAAAKAGAPAVLHIDHIEKVFIRDEKRSAQLAELDGELPCRLRTQLFIETAALKPEDGVLILGTSEQPHACVGSDESDFISFFQILIKIPIPDARSRRSMIAAFAAAQGVHVGSWEQLSAVAMVLDGYSSGQLKNIVRGAADAWKKKNNVSLPSVLLLSGKEMQFLDCVVEAAALEKKIDDTEMAAVMEWTAKAHAAKQNTSVAAEAGNSSSTADSSKSKKSRENSAKRV